MAISGETFPVGSDLPGGGPVGSRTHVTEPGANLQGAPGRSDLTRGSGGFGEAAQFPLAVATAGGRAEQMVVSSVPWGERLGRRQIAGLFLSGR